MIRAKRRKPFSFIRTVTVGFGVAPNLLTLPLCREQGARGLGPSPLPPVGTFTPPWEHRPVRNGTALPGTIRRAFRPARAR